MVSESQHTPAALDCVGHCRTVFKVHLKQFSNRLLSQSADGRLLRTVDQWNVKIFAQRWICPVNAEHK